MSSLRGHFLGKISVMMMLSLGPLPRLEDSGRYILKAKGWFKIHAEN
jgi:hypothetical protein